MKNILDFLKKVYNIVKNWIIANGITGLLGLLLGVKYKIQ